VRYGIIAGVLALILTSVVFAVEDSGGSPKLVLMNIPVPGVRLPGALAGTPGVSPAVFEGRAVLLNFWASWCPPCQAEMPTLEAAHRALGNQVTFIGVDEQDSRSDALAFLRHVGVTYGNLFDGNGAVSQAFFLDATPETFFISHGKELDLNLGALSAGTLRTDLKQLFGIRWSQAGAAA
jgi:thiol-disulfide isomerase/thioredoxin